MMQLTLSQDLILQRLVGASSPQKVAQAMNAACPSGNFYCEAAFRQDVLEGLLQ